MQIDFPSVIKKFNEMADRGFCRGVGDRSAQTCVEAAIAYAMDLPHGDDPSCVEPAIRAYKIRLNDAFWSSPQARAEGLRDLGIAQIGSRGVVDGKVFVTRLAEQTIRVLLPVLIRETPRLAKSDELLKLVDQCEREGMRAAAYELRRSLYAADAATAAYAAAAAAAAADPDAADAYAATAADAAAAAADAADAYAARRDRILRLSASLALQILIDLKSPGSEWIPENAVQKLREAK